MPDQMRILGIQGFGHHGVHTMERRAGQTFLVDLCLEIDMGEAAASDDLTDAVDYSVLARRVSDIVSVKEKEAAHLIESLVARIAAACLEDPRVAAVEVTIHKPQAPVGIPVTDISVTVRRTRADLGLDPAVVTT